MSAPTTVQSINAANLAYTQNPTLSDPGQLCPFIVNGQPVSALINGDGFYGEAFRTPQNQVIIAYEGTSPASLFSNFTFGFAQLLADLQIYLGQTPPALTDAINFATTVTKDAAAQGITAQNVFVAGHSLGAIEAEYVSARHATSGQTFAATGLPSADVVQGNTASLTDYVDYGDPVGNYDNNSYGTGLPVEGNFLYSSDINHFGTVDYIGDPFNALTLLAAGQLYGTGTENTAAALGLFALNTLAFHLLPNYASDLDISLYKPTASLVPTGNTISATALLASSPADRMQLIADVTAALPAPQVPDEASSLINAAASYVDQLQAHYQSEVAIYGSTDQALKASPYDLYGFPDPNALLGLAPQELGGVPSGDRDG